MERLRITIEFNKNRKEELNLYEKLQNYNNPLRTSFIYAAGLL